VAQPAGSARSAGKGGEVNKAKNLGRENAKKFSKYTTAGIR